MTIYEMRTALREGKTVFDLPLRVTFYARVSTDSEEQRSSLENQRRYYSEFIGACPRWESVPGYVDEGVSGTDTRKRESFLRMIRDAEAGRFDFIVTKEISRFSRSTLDSIRYTQALLDMNVGVLFQNDGINTLDADSEFRLVVMAGVAQDEVRKLSERLKFGFRQSIRNGRVLGNDSLWGYEKENCRLQVNEAEASAVRRIFSLYAEGTMGIRRLAQQLTAEGFSGRSGAPFSPATVRSILRNPKYKGWYCGGKSRSVDYRTKKKLLVEEADWVAYPDPRIPAIVSEALWERANAIYKSRSKQVRISAAPPGLRYPYSGKIFCQVHGTPFHHRKGAGERWECRVYRQQGKSGCTAPSVSTEALNAVIGALLRQRPEITEAAERTAAALLRNAAEKQTVGRGCKSREGELAALRAKQTRLLELRVEGDLSREEYRTRSESIKERIRALEQQMQAAAPSRGGKDNGEWLKAAETALHRELALAPSIRTTLAAAVVERVTVEKDSTAVCLSLEVTLKTGETCRVRCCRDGSGLVVLR